MALINDDLLNQNTHNELVKRQHKARQHPWLAGWPAVAAGVAVAAQIGPRHSAIGAALHISHPVRLHIR